MVFIPRKGMRENPTQNIYESSLLMIGYGCVATK